MNRGFSTLFNDHEVCFVLLDEAGRVCAVQPTSADVRTWQPYAPDDTLRTPLEHKVTADFVLPGGLPRGTYRLGLWLPDGADRLKFNRVLPSAAPTATCLGGRRPTAAMASTCSPRFACSAVLALPEKCGRRSCR